MQILDSRIWSNEESVEEFQIKTDLERGREIEIGYLK